MCDISVKTCLFFFQSYVLSATFDDSLSQSCRAPSAILDHTFLFATQHGRMHFALIPATQVGT